MSPRLFQAAGTKHRLCRGLVWALGLRLLAADPFPTKGMSPPMPPVSRPPVQVFRELLAASPDRREALLAGKSRVARELILRRVREYEALPAAGREEADFQLRLAEFRFYLSPLLQATPSERAPLLGRVPAEYLPIVGERLKAWDALGPDARRSVLESDQSLRYFVRQQTADADRLAVVLSSVPATQCPEVEAQFARWKALSEDDRADRTKAFRGIFDLGTGRRDKVLGRMEVPDRRTLERTLDQYSRMSPAERERILEGFGKYSRLSPTERADFLTHAARWQAMSPEERNAWRRLVLHLPPPPPLPPAGRPAPATALVVTNRN
ncbi:MAG: DUF3106 domain-containing protein [Verrucomicrobia bacterium]|nr:MAG: DUF3106 domain-containing protein [Verrucomicrobiota bacterium]